MIHTHGAHAVTTGCPKLRAVDEIIGAIAERCLRPWHGDDETQKLAQGGSRRDDRGPFLQYAAGLADYLEVVLLPPCKEGTRRVPQC